MPSTDIRDNRDQSPTCIVRGLHLDVRMNELFCVSKSNMILLRKASRNKKPAIVYRMFVEVTASAPNSSVCKSKRKAKVAFTFANKMIRIV